MSKEKVIIGMSGGVDSSVSAALLLQAGYQVEGMFMKNWEEDDLNSSCAADKDIKDAEDVCSKLNISLHKRNFSSEYWDFVFENFLSEYRKGRTPNPDILCNREIKFKTFIEHAEDLGSEKIATGHYVRKRQTDQGYQLLKGIDSNKDQSYFLYTIGQKQLAYSLFPLGNINKIEVRKIAAQLQLKNHAKKDSTGICFIGEKNFQNFLSEYLQPNPGNIITLDNQVIGQHNGLMYYTIGQRQGLGIGGVKNRPDEAWFVLAKNHDKNTLIVGQQSLEKEHFFSSALEAIDVHWISEKQPVLPLQCKAKIRYRQMDQNCTVLVTSDPCRITVEFEQPQLTPTPGQSIVFYQDEVCLGGAIINQTNQLTISCELK